MPVFNISPPFFEEHFTNLKKNKQKTNIKTNTPPQQTEQMKDIHTN